MNLKKESWNLFTKNSYVKSISKNKKLTNRSIMNNKNKKIQNKSPLIIKSRKKSLNSSIKSKKSKSNKKNINSNKIEEYKNILINEIKNLEFNKTKINFFLQNEINEILKNIINDIQHEREIISNKIINLKNYKVIFEEIDYIKENKKFKNMIEIINKQILENKNNDKIKEIIFKRFQEKMINFENKKYKIELIKIEDNYNKQLNLLKENFNKENNIIKNILANIYKTTENFKEICYDMLYPIKNNFDNETNIKIIKLKLEDNNKIFNTLKNDLFNFKYKSKIILSKNYNENLYIFNYNKMIKKIKNEFNTEKNFLNN